MTAKTVPLNPLQQAEPQVTYQITDKNMAVLLVAIEEIVRKVVKEEMNLATEKPMNPQECADFLGLNEKTVRIKTLEGLIPYGEIGGLKYYYASEINKKITEKH
jgi:hypothetical protein